MAKNILLTGASGFIGSHVLQSLIENNYHVVVLLRPTSNLWRIESIKDQFSVIILSDSMMDLDPVFKENKIDTIIHTATVYGRVNPLSDILLTNVLFPLRLLEAGMRNGLKRFINTDSFFGKNPQTPVYLKHYIESKKMLLNILKEASKPLRIDNLRLEHPFGENDSEEKFVAKLIKDLVQHKDKISLTAGNQKRDFIYVKDVANAFIKVLEQDDNFKGFNEYQVGTGYSISVKDFVQTVAAVIQSQSNLAFGELPSRSDEMVDSKADTVTLNAIGWYPRFDLQAALQQTVALSVKNLL